MINNTARLYMERGLNPSKAGGQMTMTVQSLQINNDKLLENGIQD